MENLRTLRRSRSLTFLDLAALTGIPARNLAEVEHGLRRLSPLERDTLALVLGLEPHAFTGAHRRLPPPAQTPALTWATPVDQRAVQTLLATALAATVAAGSLSAARVPLPSLPVPRWGLSTGPTSASTPGLVGSAAQAARAAEAAPTSAKVPSGVAAPDTDKALAAIAQAAARNLSGIAAPSSARGLSAEAVPVALDPAQAPAAVASVAGPTTERNLAGLASLARRLREDEALTPSLVAGPTPGEEVAPAPLPVIEAAPAFTMTENGPLGCPVKPARGRVVMTQGYGVGTHTPIEVWGAVDLAVDGDGDGYADIDASWYTPIVATHDGAVTVTLDSYPAGNHVWVAEPGGVWRTGYSHLAIVTVISGQYVRAGEQIGLLGSTGVTSGPHLDYQVWREDANVDPTWLVGCS